MQTKIVQDPLHNQQENKHPAKAALINSCVQRKKCQLMTQNQRFNKNFLTSNIKYWCCQEKGEWEKVQLRLNWRLLSQVKDYKLDFWM